MIDAADFLKWCYIFKVQFGDNTEPAIAFSAYLSTTQTAVTGDSALYTVIFDSQDSIDPSPDYNSSTGTFAAPISGFYQFSVVTAVGNFDSGMTSMNLGLVTPYASYILDAINPYESSDVSGNARCTGSATVWLNVNDTAVIKIQIIGGVGNNANILGGNNPIFSMFSGSYVQPASVVEGGGGEINITDDNTSSGPLYPVWVTANSGAQPTYVSSQKFQWDASAGTFTLLANGVSGYAQLFSDGNSSTLTLRTNNAEGSDMAAVIFTDPNVSGETYMQGILGAASPYNLPYGVFGFWENTNNEMVYAIDPQGSLGPELYPAMYFYYPYISFPNISGMGDNQLLGTDSNGYLQSSSNFQWNVDQGQLFLNTENAIPGWGDPTQAILSFSGNYSSGSYLNLGEGGRNIGVKYGGAIFVTNNLDYNASTDEYYYNFSSYGSALISINPDGGLLGYAVVGTAGEPATIVNSLTWDTFGNVNLPNIAPNQILGTDGSSNIVSVSPVSGFTLQGAYDAGSSPHQGDISLNNNNLNPIRAITSNTTGSQINFDAFNNSDSATVNWGYLYSGLNSSSSVIQYVFEEARIQDATAGGETASWKLLLQSYGSLVSPLLVDGQNQLFSSSFPFSAVNGSRTYQSTLLVTTDLSYNSQLLGYLGVSDDVSAHTITITNTYYSTNGDDAFSLQSSATYSMIVAVSGGATINGGTNNITIPINSRAQVQLVDAVSNAWVVTIESVNSNLNGSYNPTLTAVSNIGSLSLLRAFYSVNGLSSGNTGTVTLVFTGVPSGQTVEVGVTCPVTTGFAYNDQAALSGGSLIHTPNTDDGTLYDAKSIISSSTVDILAQIPIASVGQTYTFNVSFVFIIN